MYRTKVSKIKLNLLSGGGGGGKVGIINLVFKLEKAISKEKAIQNRLPPFYLWFTLHKMYDNLMNVYILYLVPGAN
jgi:hypothetical protein